MTVGDGDDILAAPTGYKKSKIYKSSFLDKRRRYMTPVKGLFGCTINEPRQFKTQLANGIMGISAHSNSYMASPNIIDQLLKSKQISRNSFSLCFGDKGGVMTIGGFNKDMHLKGYKIQSFKWEEYSNYGIRIPGIFIDGDYKSNMIDKKDYNFMFDSGTTYIWLPPVPYERIITHINNWCKDKKAKAAGKKRCIGLPSDEQFEQRTRLYNEESGLEGGLDAYLNSYPKIQFKLGKMGRALFTLHPREWMVVYPPKDKSSKVHKICGAFRKMSNGNDKALIGN